MVTARRGTLRAWDRNAISASLAALSTGGAARRIRTASSRMPSIVVRFARGMMRTSTTTPASVWRITRPLSARGGFRQQVVESVLEPAMIRAVGHARPMQQDLLFFLAGLLFADVFERVAERLNGRF